MSYRDEDKNLKRMLQELRADVDALKGANTGVKQNNIRLGDWIVTVDANGCMTCTNIATSQVINSCDTPLEAIWSYPGSLVPADLTALEATPVWYPNKPILLEEFAVFLETSLMTGTQRLNVDLQLNDVTIAQGRIIGIKNKSVVHLGDDGTNGSGTWDALSLSATPIDKFNIFIEPPAFDNIGVSLTAVLRYRYAG